MIFADAPNHDAVYRDLISATQIIVLAIIGLVTIWLQQRTKAAVDRASKTANDKIDENTAETIRAKNASVGAAALAKVAVAELVEQKEALPEAVETTRATIARQTEEIKAAIKQNGH